SMVLLWEAPAEAELGFGADPCPDFFRDLCCRADGLEVFGDVEIRFVERQWLVDRGALSRAGIARPSRSSLRGADAKPGRQHRIGADADLDLASPLLGPAGDRHNRAQGVV